MFNWNIAQINIFQYVARQNLESLMSRNNWSGLARTSLSMCFNFSIRKELEPIACMGHAPEQYQHYNVKVAVNTLVQLINIL